MTSNATARFSSQADAVKAAREAIWGDVSFAKREYVDPKRRPEVAVYVNGLPEIVVAADVNGKIVAITFDSYGRTNYGAYRVKVIGAAR